MQALGGSSRQLLRNSLRGSKQQRQIKCVQLASIRQSSQFANLESSLTSRRLPLVFDYLSPQHSHILNISLADFLPPEVSSIHSREAAAGLPKTSSPLELQSTHHLVYFPPPIPASELLPDGTDPLQSPGDPFVRRMWAGGRVRFNNHSPLTLDGTRAVCLEGIRDVKIKGAPGDEKIFVGVERRVAKVGEDEPEQQIRDRLWTEVEEDFGSAAVVERRNIVFMRGRTPAEAADAAKAPAKIVKAPHKPLFSHTLTPDAKLLFRYSALTFNAHAIHLDPEYCRNVEGHRNLLVHGPLSFTLAMTLLRQHLASASQGQDVRIKEVEYRNLCPLYAGEPLKLCGRETGAEGEYEIWVETPQQGLALRGNVKTEKL